MKFYHRTCIILMYNLYLCVGLKAFKGHKQQLIYTQNE